jgi:hypothetical protein
MKLIARFFKAVFNFFVGDWIILIGVGLCFLIVWLLLKVAGLSGLETTGGYLLFVGFVLTLGLTLYREAKPSRHR